MKKLASLLVLALASMALVACGGDNESSDTSTTTNATTNSAESEAAGDNGAKNGASGAGTAAGGKTNPASGGGGLLKFEAEPGAALAYTSTDETTSAGEVTVEFNNPQALSHDVAIEDSSGEEIGKTDLVTEGTAATTVNLKPGTYTFYCTVPGHREAGMEGTLTVK
ncbi:MAG TPA: plastocyanin/azurin family copper-binding protein [Solirubrobacterales bacterium]|nr:plastocyanin/azurin family copper-binding protein [Solirubrobacterales bacterium]